MTWRGYGDEADGGVVAEGALVDPVAPAHDVDLVVLGGLLGHVAPHGIDEGVVRGVSGVGGDGMGRDPSSIGGAGHGGRVRAVEEMDVEEGRGRGVPSLVQAEERVHPHQRLPDEVLALVLVVDEEDPRHGK